VKQRNDFKFVLVVENVVKGSTEGFFEVREGWHSLAAGQSPVVVAAPLWQLELVVGAPQMACQRRKHVVFGLPHPHLIDLLV